MLQVSECSLVCRDIQSSLLPFTYGMTVVQIYRHVSEKTTVRRALRSILSELPQYEWLLLHVKGNISFVFTSRKPGASSWSTLNEVTAPARAGAFAPKEADVPTSNTGMEPSKTSFFQALGIPTKIARGTIEIVFDVKVVTAGTCVRTSEATLLNMLNISSFTYGMTVVQIHWFCIHP